MLMVIVKQKYVLGGWSCKFLNFFFNLRVDTLLLIFARCNKLFHQGIQTCNYTSLYITYQYANNEDDKKHANSSNKLVTLNIRCKLSFSISTGTTLSIDERYKVIQISASIIIFTSFVALGEEFQSRVPANSIPACIAMPVSWMITLHANNRAYYSFQNHLLFGQIFIFVSIKICNDHSLVQFKSWGHLFIRLTGQNIKCYNSSITHKNIIGVENINFL